MKNVVIIGAGPAGLTAAYELLKNSNKYNVIILEKSNKVGGISSSVSIGGNIIDTGIHRFFSKNDEINQIWEELLPIQGKPSYDDKILNRDLPFSKNGPNPEKKDRVMLIKNRMTRILYQHKYYDYPIKMNFTTIKNLGPISIILISLSYLKSIIFKRKEDSLENLYINKFGKKLYQMFFESYTEKVWGRHPKNISADWGNQRVKGLSISEIIKDVIKKTLKIKNNNTETSLIEQFYYPKKGSIQMWEEMSNRITEMGGKIFFNVEVHSINIKNNKVSSIMYHQNGKKIKLDIEKIISSMPIKDLFKIIKGIEIPDNIFSAAVNLPYRDFVSVGFKLDNLLLKNNTNLPTIMDIAPDSWIYVQNRNVKIGRIQIFNNWSPYLFKKKKDIYNSVLLTLEYFTDKNDSLWNMSDDELITFATEEAERIKLFERKNIKDTKVIKIEKAYPGYFDSYKDMPNIISFLNSISNLYCIGRNGQHKYNNMDHSMLTGIEAIHHILYHSDDNKNMIWNVNTEQEYHEIKK